MAAVDLTNQTSAALRPTKPVSEWKAVKIAQRLRIIAALPPYHRALVETIGLRRVAVTYRMIYADAKAAAAAQEPRA